MTRISVIIPVFNRATIISRALDSVFAQDVPLDSSIKIIVVDDGSSDDLAAAVARYGERVTVIRHARNSGAGAARNTGITAADGDYIAFLDSDDIWLPGKLATQIDAMRANKWTASCTAYVLARAGQPDKVSPYYTTRALDFSDLVWGCFVSPGSTMMFERSVFDDIGPLDTTLPRLEDWDWLLRYARKHTLGFLAEPLARIEVSPYTDADKVLAAIKAMRAKHAQAMTARDRRHFTAALDLERAGVLLRRGDYIGGVPALLACICRAPFGNSALKAILYNRWTR